MNLYSSEEERDPEDDEYEDDPSFLDQWAFVGLVPNEVMNVYNYYKKLYPRAYQRKKVRND